MTNPRKFQRLVDARQYRKMFREVENNNCSNCDFA